MNTKTWRSPWRRVRPIWPEESIEYENSEEPIEPMEPAELTESIGSIESIELIEKPMEEPLEEPMEEPKEPMNEKSEAYDEYNLLPLNEPTDEYE